MEKTTISLFGERPDGCTCIWHSTDNISWILVTPCPVCIDKQAAELAWAEEQKRLAEQELEAARVKRQAAVDKLLALGLTQEQIDAII